MPGEAVDYAPNLTSWKCLGGSCASALFFLLVRRRIPAVFVFVAIRPINARGRAGVLVSVTTPGNFKAVACYVEFDTTVCVSLGIAKSPHERPRVREGLYSEPVAPHAEPDEKSPDTLRPLPSERVSHISPSLETTVRLDQHRHRRVPQKESRKATQGSMTKVIKISAPIPEPDRRLQLLDTIDKSYMF